MGSCLAPDALKAYLDQPAPTDARSEVELHLEECDRCLSAFDRLLIERELVCFETAAADSLEDKQRYSTPYLPTIPGYEVLECLGHGGHGVVYRARDLSLRREVALKLLKAGELASARECARLFVEAQAAARLKHPNIVQVYAVGEFNGLPFYAMDCYAGGSLAGRLRFGALPPQDAAKLMEKVARAVHFAHEQGVVHRDLKPANILLADESLAYPSVSDFGLAKCTGLDGEVTPSDTVFGTPNYMAPELFASVKKASPASDIYSLGAVLYELLTGRPPFAESTQFETILRARESEPVAPRQLVAAIPADLETICLKCLEKSPERRYLTASAVAEDLRRVQTGESILATRRGALATVWHKARKSPSTTIALLVLALSLAGGGLWLKQSMEAKQLDHQINALLNESDGENIVAIIKSLEPVRTQAEPNLRARAIAQAPDSLARRNAALFLIATDTTEGTYILRSIRAMGLEEAASLQPIMRMHNDATQACEFLWQALPGENPDVRLRIACILSGCTPSDERWHWAAPGLIDHLIDKKPGLPVKLLRPVHSFLLPRLMDFLSEEHHARERRHRGATLLLAFAEEPEAARLLTNRLRATPPAIEGTARLEFVKKQANLASALFVCGDQDFTRRLLHWETDPSLRSQIIENIAQDISPRGIGEYLTRVNNETHADVRQAMLLGLAREELFKNFRELPGTWVTNLLKIYREDVDAGVHGAAERLLYIWKKDETVAQEREALRKTQAPAGTPIGARRWYVGPLRLTFSLVTPADQITDSAGQRLRPFAIATREVSIKQVEDFCRTHPSYTPVFRTNTGMPSTEPPLVIVRAFCNWLTSQEMPAAEFCYEHRGDAIVPVANLRTRAGYRLPTMEEWKYACFADAATLYPHGNDPDLLRAYAVYRKKIGDNGPRHVGSLKPNRLGLFDMLGNAAEMCENPAGDIVLVGGSYRQFPSSPTAMTVPAGKDREFEAARGFRVVRTLRPE